MTTQQAMGGRLGFLLEHGWVYELVPPAQRLAASTYAYVLAKLAADERHVIYRGPLHQFALGQDGRFRYLVLRRAERYYLRLHAQAPVTTAKEAKVIGATLEGAALERMGEREIDYLPEPPLRRDAPVRGHANSSGCRSTRGAASLPSSACSESSAGTIAAAE